MCSGVGGELPDAVFTSADDAPSFGAKYLPINQIGSCGFNTAEDESRTMESTHRRIWAHNRCELTGVVSIIKRRYDVVLLRVVEALECTRASAAARRATTAAASR
jgi:hypothetical protein